jgi:protein TonB
MSRGPLAPALFVVTCLTGCAAQAPASRTAPASARDAPASRTVAAQALDIRPASVDAAVPADEYPQEARAASFEGSVLLKIFIDETGRVREAKVLDDPGHGLGDAAARTALAHFRFKPRRPDGNPVAGWYRFTVTYELPPR